MSYILDALRKSEAERRQVEAPVLSPGQAEAVELPRRRVGVWVGVAVVFLVALGAAVYGLYGKPREPDSRVAEKNERVAAAPRATGPVDGAVNTTHTPTPTRSVPEVSKRAEPPPELKPHPLAVSPEAPVRDLAGEARIEMPKPKRPAAPALARSERSGEAGAAAPNGEQVRFLRSMPQDFQRGLPELVVNIHIYAARESERILYINNRQYHAGERVRPDIVVEDIVEDGAVLSYQGQRFKLPRPS